MTKRKKTLGTHWTVSAAVLIALSLAPEVVRSEDVRPSSDDEAVSEERQKFFRETLHKFDSTSDIARLHYYERVLTREYPDSRDVLVEGVRRGSPRVCAFSVKLLGELGTPETDLHIVARALHHHVSTVRLAAVRAIKNFGRVGFKQLSEYIPTERVANNRKMAVKVIQMWGDPDAISFLADLLKDEEDRNVRRFVVTALKRLSDEDFGDDAVAWQRLARKRDDEAMKKRIENYAASKQNKRSKRSKRTKRRSS